MTASTLPAPVIAVAAAAAATAPEINLWDIDPVDYMTDEMKESYLRCSYKWSFHHIPSLFAEIQNKTLDRTLAWAILAIIIRFSEVTPVGFTSKIETSSAFAAHVRSLILPSIDEPSLQRIQVLLLLTGHSWGFGEGRRAWVYLGMAVRMAQIMNLFEESPAATVSKEEFILAEERRRTAWTCFLMDSLLSGGRGRERLLSANSMHIQLPCSSDHFYFKESVTCERIDGSWPDTSIQNPPGNLGIIAYSMRVADIWGAVAKWSCSSHLNSTAPWLPNSQLQYLLSRLDAWKSSLPGRLRYNLSLLHAHTVANDGQAYCYMHCIYFMSVIFLYRSYLPELEMQTTEHKTDDWKQWSACSSRELAKVADQVCEMLQDIRAFGPFFLRGLVPWIGFTIYTAIGTLLYFSHFPLADDSDLQIERWRQRVINGSVFLKDMRQAWPMADTWRETIKAMHLFYSNLKLRGNNTISPSMMREIRSAIIDYGALQLSPVQPLDSGSEKANEASEAEVPNIADTEYAQPGNTLPPADYDLFETQFEIGSAMEASFADATQGFWEGFPGNMEVWRDNN